MLTFIDAATAGFDADEADAWFVKEFEESTDGVGASADTGDDIVWQTSFSAQNLLFGFDGDDAVEIADHHRIRVRTIGRPQNVMRLANVGDPVAHGLVDSLLERALAGLDAPDLGAHETHAVYVEGLAFHVYRAHVDDALQAKAGADSSGSGAMLAGAGLSDDALLPHTDGEQSLADDIIDLMGPSVEHVLALKVDSGSAGVFGQRLGKGEPSRATGVIAQHVREGLLEGRIATGFIVGLGQVQQRRHQSLWHVHPAELTETAAGVRDAEAWFGGRDEAGRRHGRDVLHKAGTSPKGKRQGLLTAFLAPGRPEA